MRVLALLALAVAPLLALAAPAPHPDPVPEIAGEIVERQGECSNGCTGSW